MLGCPDIYHVSVDTVHQYLLRNYPSYYPEWYNFKSISSDVLVAVSALYVSKPPRSRFPEPLCDILYIHYLPDIIIS